MAKSKPQVKVDRSSRPITIKVKFLEDCGIEGEYLFKAGDVETVKASIAMRWIKRGKAERFTEPPKRRYRKVKKEPEPPKEVELEIEDEKKIEDSLELPSSPPITVTDPTPEIEKE